MIKKPILVVAIIKFMLIRVSGLTSTKFRSVVCNNIHRKYARLCQNLLCPPLCLLVENSIWTSVFKENLLFHVSVSISTLLRRLTLSNLLIM